MATVEEDNTLTIYDEIGMHTDMKPPEEIQFNVQYDTKEESPTETTDHTKKHSSLLDLDFTPQKTNFKPLSEKDRKSSLHSTKSESVEVYIYRRTSLVTSSGGSLIKVDDNDINSHHQHVETGLNLLDTNNTKIPNYQPYKDTDKSLNNAILHDKYDNSDSQIENNSSDIINTTENEELIVNNINDKISIRQNKSRHSLSIDPNEQHKNGNNNATISKRKISNVSGSSVVYHSSDSENDETSMNRPVRSSSIIIYGSNEMPKNKLIIESQINERHSGIFNKAELSKLQTNDFISGNLNVYDDSDIEIDNKPVNKLNWSSEQSSILELIGPAINTHNRIKDTRPQPNVHELDEQFYKQITKKERLSSKSNHNNLNQFKTNNKHNYKSKSDMNNKYMNDINDIDIKESADLNYENLMQLNYENRLDEMNDIDNINLTNNNKDNQLNKQKRYISITNDNINHELNYNQYSPRRTRMEQKELDMNVNNEIVEVKEYKLSTKIKYITAIGAVCAVTVLIGFVMFTKSQNGRVSGNKPGGMLMTPRRRGPPRYG